MNLVAKTVVDVIAAYNYILEMRKLYDSTNGEQGAFIVVTNASLGINEGKPSDYPIWCTMYDALGAEGILNVASTTNNDIDVDLKGDIPTTCSSNYLISVTNTNEKDQLINAAYGKTHIDLGAPGSNVYTTTNNGSYSIVSGTSAASPHVAGAIALLYSVPNQLFMNAVHQNPAETALLVKDCILNGTDPVFDLQYKTVTGGRLNLYNSLCALQNSYHANTCVEIQQTSLAINETFFRADVEEFILSFHLKGDTYLKARVFNSMGQLIQQKYLKHINTGMHQLSFSLQHQPHGVYYLLLNGKHFKESVKLLK